MPDGASLSVRAPRIGNLSRVDDILREARRVYRSARSGELETQDMGRFINALQVMINIMRDSSMEARLTELEKSYDARQQEF